MAKKKIVKKTPLNGNANIETKKDTEKSLAQEVAPKEAVSIFAKNEVLAGDYCNIAMVHHTEREFVLDFIFAIANQHSLVSRVITNPQHVKKFCEVLGDNIKQYETKYGKIKL